jgi:cbb3-type cytochrome oxidase subunit 3
VPPIWLVIVIILAICLIGGLVYDIRRRRRGRSAPPYDARQADRLLQDESEKKAGEYGIGH